MSSSETPPPLKPAELLTKQVPWGARKSAAPPPAAKPAAPILSAKQVPWGAAKPPVKTAVIATPPLPAIAPPPAPPRQSLIARLVPWGASKSAAKTAPPQPDPATPATAAATWALPKNADLASGQAPAESADLALRQADGSGDEPTAEELVAMLSKRLARTREKREAPEIVSQTENYRARPISFAATRWDVVRMWLDLYRVRLGLIAAAIIVGLGVVQFHRLASLNQQIDHQWHDLEAVLRDRYALIPAYVSCVTSYSTDERYTLAVTQKGLAAWRTARTDREIVNAAERLENALALLVKVMNRYDQDGLPKEEAQAESSVRFARLEEQRKLTGIRLRETSRVYDQAVEVFNAKVENPPGSWIASLGKLHPRAPFYPLGRE